MTNTIVIRYHIIRYQSPLTLTLVAERGYRSTALYILDLYQRVVHYRYKVPTCLANATVSIHLGLTPETR